MLPYTAETIQINGVWMNYLRTVYQARGQALPDEMHAIQKVQREWAKAVLFHPRAEFWKLFRQLCATRPAGWVPSKDLQSHCANSGGTVRRLD